MTDMAVDLDGVGKKYRFFTLGACPRNTAEAVDNGNRTNRNST